jgi:hypothetical protein
MGGLLASSIPLDTSRRTPMLLGPIKLAILPGLALGVVDMALRQTDVVGLMWMDLANHFRFAFVYIFGFVLTAADEHGFKDLLNKYKVTKTMRRTIADSDIADLERLTVQIHPVISHPLAKRHAGWGLGGGDGSSDLYLA